MKKIVLCVGLALGVSTLSHADEGMWTYNNFPTAKVKEAYGFEATQSWLDHARLSSVRLTGGTGCSGSIVSPEGLVMTNHHCAHTCIAQLSTAKKDYIASGFYAKLPSDEVKCPEIEINQLVDISDVTTRIGDATQGKSGTAYSDALKSTMSAIEKECAAGEPNVRCDVVTLYRGGRYDLYKYRRYQDVRLVMAPEFSIGFFGGDPDNFNFPRYNLDMAFLRIYENGKPVPTAANYLAMGTPVKEGDLVFTSGHPGTTNRMMTVAQLEYLRDNRLPMMLLQGAELRGRLLQLGTQGAEKKRVSESMLFGVENGYKVRNGQFQALTDPAFFKQIVDREQELRKKVDTDPKLKGEYGGAWDAIADALKKSRAMQDEYDYLEGGRGFSSTLFGFARGLVRAADELPKANNERLSEFGDARLPAFNMKMASTAPVYDDLEIMTLSFSFDKLREAFGNDDPLVRKVMGKKSSLERGTELVKGSKLKDPKVRQALLKGGASAIAASKDPMILLAKAIDGDARAVRKRYETEVESVLQKSGEQIGKAKFAVYGTSIYPDATFTLRLSYGQVKGWTTRRGKAVSPFTNFGGAFERATGSEPLKLPQSWLDAQSKLDPATHFDYVSTNDIIGGNSGSPLIDTKGEVVGLAFDGNIEGLGGAFAYDGSVNRTVSVDIAAILESLDKVYKADRVVNELKPVKAAAR